MGFSWLGITHMRRREFVGLLGGAAAAWPLAAYAQQQAGPIPQIIYLGALSPTTLDPRQIEQFNAGLAENGLIDGQNIKVDYLWGEGSPERLRQHATDLSQRNVSVIITVAHSRYARCWTPRSKLQSFLRFSTIQSATGS